MGPEDDEFEDFDNGIDSEEQHEGGHADDADLDDANDESGNDGGEEHSSDAGDAGRRAGDGSQDRSQSRVRSRAQRRVEEALERSRAAEERAANLERQVQELMSGRSNETQREERARVEAMDPYERAQYERDQRMDRIERALGHTAQQSQDAADRAAFEAECARNPVLRAVRDRVEPMLATLRQQAGGQFIPRALVAKLVLGEDVAAGKKVTAKRPTSERMERNRTAPSGGRSDAGGGDTSRRAGADTATARRKRLEGIQI